MKLRMRKNSVRLRLLKSEIAQLNETGVVNEKIYFSNTNFLEYSVRLDETISDIHTQFTDKHIEIRIPEAAARIWIDTEIVGLEHTQKSDKETELNILIEKDFVCLTRPMEGDNLDAFPNPDSALC